MPDDSNFDCFDKILNLEYRCSLWLLSMLTLASRTLSQMIVWISGRWLPACRYLFIPPFEVLQFNLESFYCPIIRAFVESRVLTCHEYAFITFHNMKRSVSLQMPDIQRRCELLAPSILVEEANLHRALSLSRGHRDSGSVPSASWIAHFCQSSPASQHCIARIKYLMTILGDVENSAREHQIPPLPQELG